MVRTYTGHGVNDMFHTAPNIPHYAKNKAVGTMKPGMVSALSMAFQSRCLVDHRLHQCFTIEPVSAVRIWKRLRFTHVYTDDQFGYPLGYAALG